MSWIFVDVAETKRDVVHGYTWISAVSGTDAPPPGSPQGTGGMGGGLTALGFNRLILHSAVGKRGADTWSCTNICLRIPTFKRDFIEPKKWVLESGNVTTDL